MKKPESKLLRNFRDQEEQPASPPRPDFGHGQHPAQEEAFDFAALRDGGVAATETAPRWMLPVAIGCTVLMLLGGYYFIHVTLSFQYAIASNLTSVEGPYPSSAVLFIAFPVLCSIAYFLLGFVLIRTGIDPFTTPLGLGMVAGAFVVLLLVLQLPSMLIRHKDNQFAAQHGYEWCSSPFDPSRQHIYALQSYV